MNMMTIGMVLEEGREPHNFFKSYWETIKREVLHHWFELEDPVVSEYQRWTQRGYADRDIQRIMKLTGLVRRLYAQGKTELAEQMKSTLKQHLWMLHKFDRVAVSLGQR